MDEKQDIALRASMFKELSQHVAPKRKAVEMSDSDGGELTLADLCTEATNWKKSRCGILLAVLGCRRTRLLATRSDAAQVGLIGDFRME